MSQNMILETSSDKSQIQADMAYQVKIMDLIYQGTLFTKGQIIA